MHNDNKYTKRRGALYTKGVHHFDLVLDGLWDKDKMVDASLRLHHMATRKKARWQC